MSRIALLLTALAGLEGGHAVPGALVPPSSQLSCAGPVRPGDTAGSLKARYGASALMHTLGGPEGTTLAGMVLWPADPSRRIEVLFGEGRTPKAAALRLTSARSRWSAAGLKVGSTVADVQRANGAPFTVSGFEWDYGGYADVRGGKLAKLPGGCSLSIRFDPPEGAAIPRALEGDGALIKSSDPRLIRLRAKVSELTLNLPEK